MHVLHRLRAAGTAYLPSSGSDPFVGVQVVPEPVDKWQDVGDGHHNVLQAFYDNQERFAYTFQNYVFVTRMMQV